MTVDLSAIFAAAEVAVRDLVTTSGTTLRIQRRPEGRGEGTSDPETLEWTPADPTVVYDNVPAVVAPLNRQGTGAEIPTATEVRIGDMTVLMLVDVEEVQEQDEAVVVTCRDPRLVGRVLDVVTILDSSAGAARVLHARPRTLGPGGS